MIGTAAKWIGQTAGRGARAAGRGARRTGRGARTVERAARHRGAGKAVVGASIGTAAIAGVASETLNPEGYAGRISEDLTGSRDYQAQMFGASLRSSFTASQPRMGRPGRRRPQSPPGDIVFGMYNLR